MGYSHYFRMTQDIPLTPWQNLVWDFNALLDHLPQAAASLRPLTMKHRPTDTAILIKGGGSGEDFFLPRTVDDARALKPWYPAGRPVSLFCKTDHQPYDQLVQACLLLVQQHAPDSVMIASDGAWADWQPAMEWVSKTMPDIPLNTPLFAALLARDDMAAVLASLPDPDPYNLAALDRLLPAMDLSEAQQSAIADWRARVQDSPAPASGWPRIG